MHHHVDSSYFELARRSCQGKMLKTAAIKPAAKPRPWHPLSLLSRCCNNQLHVNFSVVDILYFNRLSARPRPSL
jgi:hypothetical protein